MAITEVSKVVAAPHREMIVDVRNGCKLFVIPNDLGISAELRLFKIHEPLATEVLVKALKKGTTVVDIGSNIGYYVFSESKLVGQNGIVIAVEPVPVTFSYLLKNVRMNKLSNVITVNKAMSDRNGTIRMIESKGSNWSRVLQNNQDLSSPDVAGVIQVKAVTLDTLVEQLGLKKLDLIRMDVEGHEYHIMKGCCTAIRKWFPDILIEVHPTLLGKERLRSLLCMFRDFGYTIKYLIPRNMDIPLVASDEDITVMNIDELISCPMVWNFTLFMKHSSK